MDVQFDRILAEGLDARFARHAAMSKAVQDWCIAHGMEPLAPATISAPRPWSPSKMPIIGLLGDLNKFLLTKGMRIAKWLMAN